MTEEIKKETLLIISGGGLKIAGAAIGALKVLEKHFKENEIKIDRVVGISGGAVVAGLFALGYNTSQMTKMILHGWTRDIFLDFNPLLLRGIIKGNKIEEVMKWGFANKKFSEVKIPLSIVVSKIGFLYAKPVIIDSGYIHEATRASVAIPGFLEPKEIKFLETKELGKLYYDGGLAINNLYEALSLFGTANLKEVYFLTIEQKKLTRAEKIIKFINFLFKWRSFVGVDRPVELLKDTKVHQIVIPIFDRMNLWETEHFPFLILEGERAAESYLKNSS